ncbi:hypothetical protein ACIBG8_47720 [Nonomuraea sp. NPDC050556]|uniref:hypothetical protein n=1 Tax=Nonomuraea sp. NPDC050556 TaxID=3364369 RepID=UPI0037BA9C8A
MHLSRRLADEMVVCCFVVLVVTGAFLAFFYRAGGTPVVYGGPFAPLLGIEMSQAYASTMRISFEVRGGLLIRHLHAWSALLLGAGVLLRAALTWRWALLLVLVGTGLLTGWRLTDGDDAGWWYGGHLVVAVGVLGLLLPGVRPGLRLIAGLGIGLVVLALYFPLNQIWLYGPAR